MHRMMAVLALSLAACGDVTSSVGELGRLRYSLFTDYEVPGYSLTDARIVTGHEQIIDVYLTEDGRNDVTTPNAIVHEATGAGVSIDTSETAIEEDVPGFRITVASAGEVVIESKLDGEVFDRIRFNFATPTSFDLILQARAPYADAFSPVSAGTTISCVEGTQVTIDAAPKAGSDRLAGMMQTTVTIDPSWMAVPGVGVIESYENSVWQTTGQANFYFIEPGPATLTVADPVSGAQSTASFDVTAMPHVP